MQYFEYIILGAGPSGLAFAHTLLRSGIDPKSILVLEQETEPGGLCRSCEIDSAPLDMGGGHFLDVRNTPVLDFLFSFMPKHEWLLHERISTIRLHGCEIGHPLEGNLWQLPTAQQIDYLESIAQAGSVRGEAIPESFAEWIRWKLGEKIADNYMIPYNSKIWGIDLDRLGTYWLYKLPNVSFRETLKSCLEHRTEGTLPAHGQFYYPKSFGYGEIWKRMGTALGECLLCQTPVVSIDVDRLVVNNQWKAQKIVSSIPWACWQLASTLPETVAAAIRELIHVSIDVDYVETTPSSPAHWIYEPSLEKTYHRQLLRSNFVPQARGHWTETNALHSSEDPRGWRYHNEYAYPVNTRTKPQCMNVIKEWALSKGIVPLGRWGEWEHMNSDVAVDKAMKLASRLAAHLE